MSDNYTSWDIDEIKKLEDNWDGYGAIAISNKTIRNARKFLDMITNLNDAPAPDISPFPSGTISFEWHVGDRDIYLEIGDTLFGGWVKTKKRPVVYMGGGFDDLDQPVSIIVEYLLY